MIRISIVTPTLNVGGWIAECLASVAAQGVVGTEVEHIVIDGGSTDDTLEIVHGFGVRVIHTDPGLYSQINEGMRQARGEVIGYLGGDDTMLPGAVEAVRDWYYRRRSGWAVGGIRWTDAEGRAQGDIAAPPRWITPPIHASLGWSCIHHQSTFLTREFLRKAGEFDPSLRYSGDFEFFARALTLGPFDRIAQVLTTFRRHGDNVSMSTSHVLQEELRSTQDAYAPPGATERAVLRQVLRVWVNATNPAWFVCKRAPALYGLLTRRAAPMHVDPKPIGGLSVR